MNIWTKEVKPSEELKHPITRPIIKEFLTQQTAEEALANCVFAYIAWRHHGMTHMFESAVDNLFFKPMIDVLELDGPPLSIDITTRDLDYFKMHIKRFIKCIIEIQKVLHDPVFIESQKEEDARYGPADPVMILKISLFSQIS
jgi:hypothetical protein